MTKRYKANIIALLDKLHEARIEPFENIQNWLILQETLLKKLIYIENRIRFCKKQTKELNAKRKNPNIRLTKAESIVIKDKLKLLDYKIEEYRWIILILKSIGDGIAFTFLHKFDIKPQNFKQSPGFISEKKGLILEKKILRHCFKLGQIAILNDLTSVLKYADVTIITNKGILYIEAKSSNMDNARISRQSENAEKLVKYLSEDVVTDLYGENTGEMIRVETVSPEINYIDSFNKSLLEARKNGLDITFFEAGFLCLIAYEDSKEIDLDEIIMKSGISKPIPFHLNMYKFLKQGYYPFSLLFEKSEDYWDFLEGSINVLLFIDLSIIEEIATNNGYIVEQSKIEHWAFTFKSVDAETEISEFSISEHYFFRAFMEMVSLEWLLQDSFNGIKNKLHEINRP